MAIVTLEKKDLEDLQKTVKDLNTGLAEKTAELDNLKKRLAEPASATGLNGGQLFAQLKDPTEEKRMGFKSLGHQLTCIKEAKLGNASNDVLKMLHNVSTKAATGLGEGVGPDGGFLLAPQFIEGILEIAHKEDQILGMCDKYEMTSPSMKLRAVDETSRATGSRRGGVRHYWIDEGGTLTSSKPKFRQIELVPHKITILTYMTEELLQDTTMMEQMCSRYAAEELNFGVGNAVYNGTGAGQPLGVLNHACLVSISKETGQAATTIVFENIQKMYARLHASSRASSAWFINQDTLPQLNSMTLGVGTAGVAAYLPPGGLSAKPYATLMGSPVHEIEYAPTLGTVGDITLLDLKQYIVATRGNIMAANSVHVQFLTDEQVFKWTWRVAGMGWWNSALTPFQGTNTQSPFIALATRA